jgi:hypothetical protein
MSMERNRMIPGSQHHMESFYFPQILVESHLSLFRCYFLEEMSPQRCTDQNVNLQWFLVGRREMSIYMPTWDLSFR